MPSFMLRLPQKLKLEAVRDKMKDEDLQIGGTAFETEGRGNGKRRREKIQTVRHHTFR